MTFSQNIFSTRYVGTNCETVAPCGSNPCLNGASCLNTNNFADYECTCTAGYTGSECEIDIPCHSAPCLNGGTCDDSDDYTYFNCTCPVDYVGTICETLIPCTSSPCENTGVCTDFQDYSDYSCACPSDFTGKNCETFIPCSITPCLNGATCIDDLVNQDYTCQCTTEYTGTVCQTLIPCSLDPCQNSGTCVDSNDYSSYTCTCTSDYTGTNCEFFIPCNSNPCQNAGTCVNDVDWGGFSCDCAYGWTGDTCEDVDQCAGDQLDVAFLFQVEVQDGTFEGSNSDPTTHLIKFAEFAREIIGKLDIDSSATGVGALEYNYAFSLMFNLEYTRTALEGYSLTTMEQHNGALDHMVPSAQINKESAVGRYAQEHIFNSARAGAQKIAIVITDTNCGITTPFCQSTCPFACTPFTDGTDAADEGDVSDVHTVYISARTETVESTSYSGAANGWDFIHNIDDLSSIVDAVIASVCNVV